MKTQAGLIRPLLLLCLLGSGVFLSCQQSLPVNQEAETEQSAEPLTYPLSEIDTSIRLSFNSGVRAILEDSHGNIWFGSHEEGVARFDGEKLTYFTVADGLTNNQVRSIYEDAAGVVWFECGVGLSSYNGLSIVPQLEKSYATKNDWQKGENDLWFKGDEATGYNATEGAPGVYRYDGQSLNFHSFYHAFPLLNQDENLFYLSISTPFARGQDNMVWLGTYGAVIGYDGTAFTIFDNDRLGFTEETGFLHVRSLFEDSQGQLWIGNNGIGVLRYDGEKMVNFSAEHDLVTNDNLPRGGQLSGPGTLEHIFAIAEDIHGNIWFGDRDTGAWKYDGEKVVNYGGKDGLPVTHIWQIYSSKSGELWFALANGSVYRFNGVSFDRLF